jgi:SAM-dependent methyltransferase
MVIVNPERYQKLLAEAQAAAFSGWDFSWLEGRMLQEEPPWDYPGIVRAYFDGVHSLLDLGTGGGELLASLVPLPPDSHATEAYPPNRLIATKHLSKLGVKVHSVVEGDQLPFIDNRFDLVINRHESYNPAEVHRILKPEGVFITQQVGGLDNMELNQALQDKPSFPYISWSFENALTGLYELNFWVKHAQKTALKTTFLDIGAVVYYLKAIPWQIEGFNPESDADRLIQLHNIIERHGQFSATAHRFLIIAEKKKV